MQQTHQHTVLASPPPFLTHTHTHTHKHSSQTFSHTPAQWCYLAKGQKLTDHESSETKWKNWGIKLFISGPWASQNGKKVKKKQICILLWPVCYSLIVVLSYLWEKKMHNVLKRQSKEISFQEKNGAKQNAMQKKINIYIYIYFWIWNISVQLSVYSVLENKSCRYPKEQTSNTFYYSIFIFFMERYLSRFQSPPPKAKTSNSAKHKTEKRRKE